MAIVSVLLVNLLSFGVHDSPSYISVQFGLAFKLFSSDIKYIL